MLEEPGSLSSDSKWTSLFRRKFSCYRCASVGNGCEEVTCETIHQNKYKNNHFSIILSVTSSIIELLCNMWVIIQQYSKHISLIFLLLRFSPDSTVLKHCLFDVEMLSESERCLKADNIWYYSVSCCLGNLQLNLNNLQGTISVVIYSENDEKEPKFLHRFYSSISESFAWEKYLILQRKIPQSVNHSMDRTEDKCTNSGTGIWIKVGYERQ